MKKETQKTKRDLLRERLDAEKQAAHADWEAKKESYAQVTVEAQDFRKEVRKKHPRLEKQKAVRKARERAAMQSSRGLHNPKQLLG